MNKFHWFQAKQLDRVTNYSAEIEILKYANKNNIKANYYCTFLKRRKYYGCENNIKYLGLFKNKYLKFIEFRIRVIVSALLIVLREKNSVLMVNQDLIIFFLPANWINRILKRNNKFITDIRTTPTTPEKFGFDMIKFHSQFRFAILYFNGYSFITPFMEKYIMNEYKITNYSSINWSSGVDIKLFNPEIYSIKRNKIFQLFYHGGISISRGNLELIKAVQKLNLEGYNLELIQVGICVDKEILEYIETNQLQGWCKLLPPVPLPEIPQLIANCDLPVLPFPNFMAWRVSSPIKLMEYLAMGKKVLAPYMEAFTDVFKNNDNLIYYFKPEDNDLDNIIYSAIKRIIDSRELCDGNYYPDARTLVSTNYTWDKQADILFKFCKNL